jgi:hypothetical protein
MILKTVNLQEANGLLALVKERLQKIKMLLIRLDELRNKSAFSFSEKIAFDKSNEVLMLAPVLSAQKDAEKALKKMNTLEHEIARETEKLLSYGAIVKDLFPSHVDFISMRNYQPIFLCWTAGEAKISHWHLMDDSMPLRQPFAQTHKCGQVVH